MSQGDFQAQNPYASFGHIAADAPAADRLAFIKRTYIHLALAVYALVVLEFIYFSIFGAAMNDLMPKLLSPVWYLLMFGGFIVSGWVARSWADSTTSVGKQYAGLAVGVLGWSVMLAPLLWIANHYVTPIGTQTYSPIAVAGLITFLVFGALTAAVFLTRVDFSFLAPILAIATAVAFGLILASFIFQGLTSGMWFSAALVVLASGYILYDTSNVLHHYRTTQHVAAALALFSSVALLFWYILRIVIAVSGRR
ncbi:Bax inhibitor-1 family protein [Aeoliella sp. ICT_H6.2]|uniref:Bax inhibitor-1 family protein n=1 Tax=Aeoliella straminimaris TaxID=2954799 RepID=A0A9X2JHF0_9BACT|nr:Bax inhibitor-1 family protein [Aeoliella straminimaris]MCO6044563.1 Bax inhibitor-1 family protein [Aeoliella straminimaris]